MGWQKESLFISSFYFLYGRNNCDIEKGGRRKASLRGWDPVTVAAVTNGLQVPAGENSLERVREQTEGCGRERVRGTEAVENLRR